MAVSTITNLSNSLRRQYADRYFKAFQNFYTPLLDELDECPDEPTIGSGWFFPFYMSTPQNWRINPEAGNMGTVYQRSEVQGQVNAVEFLGWLQLSEMLKNAGVKSGAWNGGEVARQMDETTKDVTKGMQRIFSSSHGTGRLAVVQDNTVASNTFIAANDLGVQALEEQDEFDVYDLDTGGVSVITGRKVTAINRNTRQVTFSGAAASLTAGYGLYKAGSYGNAPNGMRNLIDNGVYADMIHGQSRTTWPKLRSQISANGGTPRPLTVDLLQQVNDDIYHAGGEIDSLSCNTGQLRRIHALQEGDLRYNIERGKTAKMVLGFREGDLTWNYDKGTYVIHKNPNQQARSIYMYGLKRGFMKHTLRKLGYLDEGGSVLRLAPGSGGGFGTSWIALVCSQVNISCEAPCWQGEVRDLEDTLAGDVITP